MHGFIVPDIFQGRVTAFFTDRHTGAEAEVAASAAGIGEGHVYMPIQKHTDKIIVVEGQREPKIGDAVVTHEKGILLGVRAADCVPVLMCDMEKKVVAAVHAGWRGTAAGILRKTLDVFLERYMCRPEDIRIALGPSIRWCCYHVDHEVLHAVEKATGEGEYHMHKGMKYCLDLPFANRYQALSAGIPASGIWMSADCTYCNPEKYFSYRFAQGTAGRQGGFIGMTR